MTWISSSVHRNCAFSKASSYLNTETTVWLIIISITWKQLHCFMSFASAHLFQQHRRYIKCSTFEMYIVQLSHDNHQWHSGLQQCNEMSTSQDISYTSGKSKTTQLLVFWWFLEQTALYTTSAVHFHCLSISNPRLIIITRSIRSTVQCMTIKLFKCYSNNVRWGKHLSSYKGTSTCTHMVTTCWLARKGLVAWPNPALIGQSRFRDPTDSWAWENVATPRGQTWLDRLAEPDRPGWTSPTWPGQLNGNRLIDMGTDRQMLIHYYKKKGNWGRGRVYAPYFITVA